MNNNNKENEIPEPPPTTPPLPSPPSSWIDPSSIRRLNRIEIEEWEEEIVELFFIEDHPERFFSDFWRDYVRNINSNMIEIHCSTPLVHQESSAFKTCSSCCKPKRSNRFNLFAERPSKPPSLLSTCAFAITHHFPSLLNACASAPEPLLPQRLLRELIAIRHCHLRLTRLRAERRRAIYFGTCTEVWKIFLVILLVGLFYTFFLFFIHSPRDGKRNKT